MDAVSMAMPMLAASQQLTQQTIAIAVMKSEMAARAQVVELLAAAAEQPVATSGALGTNVNTFA